MSERSQELQIEELHPASFGWTLQCCGWDRQEAEEVLQTTYVKILSGRARFDGRSSLKTWLFAVIRRTASERRRGSGPARPLRLAAAGAAVVATALLSAWLVALKVSAPPRASVPSLSDWQSPTAFLLRTPGQEILASPPELGRGFTLDVH